MKKEQPKSHKIFGLIGKNISYSFSPKYFAQKFQQLNLPHSYQLFDLQSMAELPKILETKNLHGLNVTIPYKADVIPYLDQISEQAKAVGAVNTIAFENGKTVGYNTDIIGFQESLSPKRLENVNRALILGTGGASRAIVYALEQLQISSTYVSRNPHANGITYSELTSESLKAHTLIVNCTPLGSQHYPNDFPPIPLEFIDSRHWAYDLIYNPAETKWLRMCKENGAYTQNGLAMLQGQADASWEIWQKSI